MSENERLIRDLKTLNQIAQTVNQAVDVKTALDDSLEKLVRLIGLETGWIFVREPAAVDRWAGHGFQLAAYYQLPPALDLNRNRAWDKSCSCQNRCLNGDLNEAYNEIHCSRLAESSGDKRGLKIHASVPLKSGSRVLGIMNIAASNWDAFDERLLSMLTTIGAEIGIALERARLHDMLRQRRIQEQSALLTFSQKLLRGTSLEELELFIVGEARRLLDVDASALLLPDRKNDGQLFFKAATGWQTDPVGAGRRVIGDERSKIGRVLITKKPMIGAVHKHLLPATVDYWAAEENFGVFSAVPLVVDEVSIGVLVIYSRSDRVFADDDLRFLQLLANQAAIALEGARLIAAQIEQRQLEKELAVGHQIQRSMLPERVPTIAGWQFAVAIAEARAVGGDFYDFFPFSDDPTRWGILIADVSDKGVPAALFMVFSRTTIRNTARPDRTPADVLRLTNRYLLADSQSDMFLSAFYAVLDTSFGRLTFSNAGHNPPIFWRAGSKKIVRLTEHGTLLGIVDELHLDNHSVVLDHDDVLVLYTDGVTEAMNGQHEEFGILNLEDVVETALSSQSDISAQELNDIILAAVNEHVGDQPQFDDLTLFVIKRMKNEPSGKLL